MNIAIGNDVPFRQYDVTAYVLSQEYVIPSPIVELVSRLEARIAALEVVVFSHLIAPDDNALRVWPRCDGK